MVLTNALLTEYQYDTICRLQKEIIRGKDNTETVKNVTHYTYDYFDRMLTKKISESLDTPVSTTPLLYEETITYDDKAVTETKAVTGDASAPNIVATVTKDKFGRVIRQDYGGNCYETFTYDTLGNKRSATNLIRLKRSDKQRMNTTSETALKKPRCMTGKLLQVSRNIFMTAWETKRR